MYNNIGGKIKTLAKVIAWIGIAFSVITGIIFIVQAGKSGGSGSSYYSSSYSYVNTVGVTGGIAILILGPLFSWIGSWLLYAFGELVERVTSIDGKLSASARPTSAPNAPHSSSSSEQKQWTCSVCKAENPDGKLFCKDCGAVKP